jgi:hypothetical protein
MTANDFRTIALSFPETTEAAHMGHPDFRVRGKIFATLYPGETSGMVKLTPEQQEVFVQAEPKVFTPVKGGWGRRGCTTVNLRAAKKVVLRSALTVAWCNTAPKRLVEESKSK